MHAWPELRATPCAVYNTTQNAGEHYSQGFELQFHCLMYALIAMDAALAAAADVGAQIVCHQ